MVLVVEDDPDCREMICGTLKDAGYAVLEADDGAKALGILLTENAPRPTVIVLDLGLPTMSGPELLKVLRSYHRFSQIPVILTSAGPRYIDGRNEAGWLPKPFDAEHLLALVNERCRVPPSSDDSGLGQSS
jgi:DNA-binding response OmpR family regulator